MKQVSLVYVCQGAAGLSSDETRLLCYHHLSLKSITCGILCEHLLSTSYTEIYFLSEVPSTSNCLPVLSSFWRRTFLGRFWTLLSYLETSSLMPSIESLRSHTFWIGILYSAIIPWLLNLHQHISAQDASHLQWRISILYL